MTRCSLVVMMLCLLFSRLVFASAFEMRLVEWRAETSLSELGTEESKSQNEERGVWYIIHRSVLRLTIQASIRAKGHLACMRGRMFLKRTGKKEEFRGV
jgi:hypothetical protein